MYDALGRFTAGRSVPTGQAPPGPGTINRSGRSVAKTALERDIMVYVRDVEHGSAPQVGYVAPEHTARRSLVCTPVRTRSHPVGVLSVESPRAARFSDAALTLIVQYATRVGEWLATHPFEPTSTPS